MEPEPELLARLGEAVDGRALERVEFLQTLVRTPSVTGDEALVQDLVEEAFGAASLDVRRQHVDRERIAPYVGSSPDSDFTGRHNVIGTRRGAGGGRSLVLNAHVDTVTPGDEAKWSRPPFSGVIEDGALWGRGACDMKAGLAACLYAVKALEDAGVVCAGDVSIAATVAEESGGAGSLAYVLEERPDAAVVAEPTRLAVAPAHTGSSHLRVVLTGESAHACVRELGVSAVELFVSLFAELRAYELERNDSVDHPLYRGVALPVPLNVGVVRGGELAAIVPDRVDFDVRLGVAPGEDVAEVVADFEHRLRAWAQRDPWTAAHPPQVERLGVQFAATEVPLDADIVDLARSSAAAVLGERAELRGMTYGTDMHHFVHVGGIPTVLFGPGDIGRAHRHDECVPLADVHDATLVLAAIAASWCGSTTG